MKVLLINQFFWPDTAPTGQLLADLGTHLAQNGHEVTVICGSATYAGEGTGGSAPPVTIVRLRAAPFTRGIAGRSMSYATFLAGCMWKIMTLPAPDVVVTLTTPPLLPLLGTVLKASCAPCRHYIWEMDVFPDTLVSARAMSSGSLSFRLLGKLADFARNRSDGILALGECMRERLAARGVPRARIHVVQNWADSRLIRTEPHEPQTPLRLLYSGNLGRCHDIETLTAAIMRYRDNGNVRFIFAGGGANRGRVESMCNAGGLQNVTFLPYAGRADMSRHLGRSHIGLVTQSNQSLGTVVPSKTYAFMAAGRAILYIGPREATPARLIREFDCGWQIDCGDSARLISLLAHLETAADEVCQRGLAARRAFEDHFDVPRGVSRVSRILEQSAA